MVHIRPHQRKSNLFQSPVTVNFDLDGGYVLDAEAVAQLTANGSIHEGDQLTVIICKLINGSFIYVTESCLVKVGETLCEDLYFTINEPIAVVGTGDDSRCSCYHHQPFEW